MSSPIPPSLQPRRQPSANPIGHAIHTVNRAHSRRWVSRLMFGILILGVIALIGFGTWFSYSISAPVGGGKTQIVIVPSNTSIHDIGTLLSSQGLIRDQTAFELYARLGPARGQLKPGPYQLKSTMSIVEILDYLAAGKIAVRSFVARQGQTVQQLANSYQQQGFGAAGEFSSAVEAARLSPASQAIFGNPSSLEGFLLGDTYQLVINDSASVLVTKMLANLDSKVTPLFKVPASYPNKLTAYQVLTLASIIEKEASSPVDQAGVAGVFYNRLKRGIKLESDVTVIYLTGRIDVTAADLAIDSPYNTRRYPGLTPTPINSPSLSAIEAALAPTVSDYLFFIGGKDGNVYYAKTYAEHQANIAKYLD